MNFVLTNFKAVQIHIFEHKIDTVLAIPIEVFLFYQINLFIPVT